MTEDLPGPRHAEPGDATRVTPAPGATVVEDGTVVAIVTASGSHSPQVTAPLGRFAVPARVRVRP